MVEESIAIEVRDAVKRFGSVTALAGASLTIRDNEFFTLLGPSGCGKTTLLRLIAGFEDITEGTILLYGEELGDLPPNKRPINTVFQHYALFPHMTVAENVAFGMRRLGWSKADIEDQTARILDLVKLGDLAARRPSQLSGGQQQRVALARAMAPRPRVLLLDEPLSALDLKLRQAMRIELKQIQKDTGITFVFVTHDQEEALTMSDRIAVMSAGEIRQIGTPHEIYEAPVDRFVANFIGETNVLDVTVQRGPDGAYTCRLSNGAVFPCQATGTPSEDGATAHVLIRPERLSFVAAKQGDRGLTGVVDQNRLSRHRHPVRRTARRRARRDGPRAKCRRGREALPVRRPGGPRHRPRRRPAAGGLMTAELSSTRAVSHTFAPVRTGLLIPTWVVIGFFLLAPVLMMLVYSFLTKEFRGGVIWEFSLAAYDQFIFDRGLFGDDPPKIEWTYIVHLRTLDHPGRRRHRPLSHHRLPDGILHRHPVARDPLDLALPGHGALLGEPAHPHRLDEVSHPGQRAAQRSLDGSRTHQRADRAHQHRFRRAARSLLLVPALHGAARLCVGGALRLRAFRSGGRPLRRALDDPPPGESCRSCGLESWQGASWSSCRASVRSLRPIFSAAPSHS